VSLLGLHIFHKINEKEIGDRSHNRHGPKREEAAVPLSRGELGPRLTQCGWHGPMSTSVPSGV